MTSIKARHYGTGTGYEVILQDGEISALSYLFTGGDDCPYVAPGLVDVQVNGYGGQEFNDPQLTTDKVRQIALAMDQDGVVEFCPTFTTAAYELLFHSISTVAEAIESDADVARRCQSLHLEGPYISPEDGPRGAHPLEHVRPPCWDEFQNLQEAAGGRIRILTLSPEYDGSAEFIAKAVDSGVHGLIAVNRRAGGHAGGRSAYQLLEEVGDFGLPVTCAGGIGRPEEFADALSMGYEGVQMGTRFIATEECRASLAYKRAIVGAQEGDIVLTERLTGVPVAVINTPYVQRLGLKAGPLARRMLKGHKTKHWMRNIYSMKSAWTLKRTAYDEDGTTEYWQAGRSVSGIEEILPVSTIIETCVKAVQNRLNSIDQ